MKSIPIVDLKDLEAVDNVSEDQRWLSAAEKIRDGLGSVGFLYLINHGIPEELISQVFTQSRNFFAMPNNTKLKYKKDTRNDGKTFDMDKYSGYVPPGEEQLHPDAKYEAKETFDWLDNGRGVYPTGELPGFEPSIIQLDIECKQLLRKLLKLLALGLKLNDTNFFVKACRHFEEPDNYKGIYNIRLIHYPPISETDVVQPGSVRCGEHSDYVFLTLLFQDDVGGLEVKNVDGNWVHAEPIPGSIIVNTGDLTEFWTGGVFPATPHRIAIPDSNDAKRKKSRYSVAFFNGPDFGTVITPLDLEKRPHELERITKKGQTYERNPIEASEYVLGRVAVQYTQQ